MTSGAGDFVLIRRAGRAEKDIELRQRSGKVISVIEGDRGGSIDHIYPSPDGRFLAYVETHGGSEEGILRIVDVGRHKLLEESADCVRNPRIHWWQDGTAFSFTRYPSRADLGQWQHARALVHRLGTTFDADVPWTFDARNGGFTFAANDFPTVAISPDGRWAVASIYHGVAREMAVLIGETNSLGARGVHWRSLIARTDQVTSIALGKDGLYLVSEKDAPNGRVLKVSLSDTSLAAAAVVLPESSTFLQELAAGRSGIYISALDKGVNQLSFMSYDRSGTVASITLPQDASVRELSASAHPSGDVAVLLEGWFRRPEWMRFASVRGEPVAMAEDGDRSEYRGSVRRLTVRSADGTEVPLTILAPSQPTQTPAPTILFAYGNYGIPMVPQFYPDIVAWIQRGGIYAIAHVRGGGEKGVNWHRAGMKENKYKATEDYIAAAEYLLSSGVAGRRGLVAASSSAGGVVVGSAVVQHPELFAGAFFKNAVLNPLRFQAMASGQGNVPEYGDASTPDGFRILQAMDPYEHIKTGATYPNMLLAVGANDPRVAPWQAAKFAERVRQATAGRTSVFVRVAFDEGHGRGSSAGQVDSLWADAHAFAWMCTRPYGPASPMESRP